MDQGDFYLSEDEAEWIGLKKSEYLSKLIEEMDPSDFGFEDFHKFDEFISQTLERPDQAIEKKEDGFVVRTCLKTYAHFHQIVIGGMIPDKEGRDVFVPILSFVSRKEKLVEAFGLGPPLSKTVLN